MVAPIRKEAASFAAALELVGVAPSAAAVVLPEGADPGGLSPVASAPVVLVDAEKVDLATALDGVRGTIPGGGIVVVRGKVKGEGMLGGLRGRRGLEDLVEPLVALGLDALGVVEIKGLFGPTLVWGRLRADASDWRA